MAIELFEGGGMAITGGHMALYRLIMLKQALVLESKGMRLTRGPKATTIARTQYGLKGDRAKLTAQVQALIDNFIPADEEEFDEDEDEDGYVSDEARTIAGMEGGNQGLAEYDGLELDDREDDHEYD